MFNMKMGGIFGAGITVAMLVASMLGGAKDPAMVSSADSQRAATYADIAVMKSVCKLSAEEESAVNATLADLMRDMTETEINIARSLAGTKGLTLAGKAEQDQACSQGFSTMAALPG